MARRAHVWKRIRERSLCPPLVVVLFECRGLEHHSLAISAEQAMPQPKQKTATAQLTHEIELCMATAKATLIAEPEKQIKAPFTARFL